MTTKELQQKTGYSHVTINKWLKQGRTEDEILNLPKQAARVNRPKTNSEPFLEAQARKERALADLRELELSVKRGELIEADQVNQWIAGMILRSRDVLLRIAPELKDKLAQESDAITIELMIDAEVRRALDQLSKPLEAGAK
jgi:hypothetical protein